MPTRTPSHDPFRRSRMRTPQLEARHLAAPVEGPMVVHAHVDRYPPRQNAGAEWMLHHLLRPLVERGHRATVSTATPEPYILEGVEVYPADAGGELTAEADVLVGHLLWTHRQLELAQRHGRALVYIAHNDDQLHYWKLRPGDLTAVVMNSEWIAKAYERKPMPNTRSVTVRPPVWLADYQRTVPWRDRRFVTLVNPNPDKGGHLLMELAKRMPDVEFLTVDGAYGQQLRPPKGVSNVTRQRPTPDMADDVYARTRILLVPSRYESWGRVAAEAMCQGIPVLAHPTPGLLECAGSAGIFLDRDDPDAWEHAITSLTDRGRWELASASSLERARELDATATADVDTWEGVLRECAAVTRDPVSLSADRGPSPSTRSARGRDRATPPELRPVVAVTGAANRQAPAPGGA